MTWEGLREVALNTGAACPSEAMDIGMAADMINEPPIRLRHFDLQAPYSPCGDQPRAISGLVEGLEQKLRFQTLRGATGTGKTFVMAQIINATQRPTLVLAPNKMLAAQLCNELKDFFPRNKIEYFVSYYDYYRPEAYMAVSDVFVEKVSVVNDDIDRLRHSATSSLFERRDTVIVSSVSCIYGLGMPTEYLKHALRLHVGKACSVLSVASRLQEIHYVPNDIDELKRGQFLVTRDISSPNILSHTFCATLEVGPAHTEDIYTLHFRVSPSKEVADSNETAIDKTYSVVGESPPENKLGHTNSAITCLPQMYLANITVRERRCGEETSMNSTAAVAVAAAKIATDHHRTQPSEVDQVIDEITIYPASHFVTSQDEKSRILTAIRAELQQRVEELEDEGMFLEAERLTQRTEADLLQIESVGYCRGVSVLDVGSE